MNYKMSLSLLFLLFLIVSQSVALDSTFVNTTSGPIRGKEVKDLGAHYFAFQGIPYAEAPTKDLRFKPPVPKAPWLDVLNATIEGAVCPQTEGTYTKAQMNEDCLHLNIYVPAKHKKLLPVLVYIHGGEFKSNAGNSDNQYGPQFLMKRNIIFATFNYRLGALGFLSLDVEEASGNAGLKDALLALRWIYANIYRFGGDPKRITLGGNSAGAVATHYLMLTEKTSGLFNQAILISGSALGYRFLARDPKITALMLAETLNIHKNTTHEVLQQLKEADAFDIVKAQEDMGENDKRKGFRPFAPFVPSVEIKHKNALITRDPLKIIKDGIPQNVPVFAGWNKDEGLKMYTAIRKDWKLIDYLNENIQLCIPSDIEYPYESDVSIDLANRIKKFYFNNRTISNDTMNEFFKLVTDTMFAYNIDNWIKVHKQKENSNDVYYYVFGFDGDLNWFKVSNKVTIPGTGHTDELGYLFVTKATRDKLKNISTKTQKMVDTLTVLLTNFVKYGHPTPENKDSKMIWPESGKNRNHLFLDVPSHSQFGVPNPKRLQFWQTVYDQYTQYKIDGGQLEKKVIP